MSAKHASARHTPSAALLFPNPPSQTFIPHDETRPAEAVIASVAKAGSKDLLIRSCFCGRTFAGLHLGSFLALEEIAASNRTGFCWVLFDGAMFGGQDPSHETLRNS
jgi:hypothetical protein